MSPAQSKMILRKLEKLEEAYVSQAKRLKLAESDLQVMTMRTQALTDQVGQLTRRLGHAEELSAQLGRTELMVDQLMRIVNRRGWVELVEVEPPRRVAAGLGEDPPADSPPVRVSVRARVPVRHPLLGHRHRSRPRARSEHPR